MDAEVLLPRTLEERMYSTPSEMRTLRRGNAILQNGGKIILWSEVSLRCQQKNCRLIASLKHHLMFGNPSIFSLMTNEDEP